MNCPFASQIDDYVDGALPAAASTGFEAHLQGCDSCPAIVADLRTIRATASRLERHLPPASLWTRIEQQVPARRRWYAVFPWSGAAWTPVAAGALVLVTLMGLATWLAFGRGATRPAMTATATPAAAPAPESVDAELTLAQQHYERAIAGLEQITSSEGAALDEQTSAELQKNVSVIDQAISESRAALETQPASVAAQESLFDALRSKVALLQDTVSLINEMRKGDADGTARIISGLNP